MARTLITAEAIGSPTAAAFEAAFNLSTAGLLSSFIGGLDIIVTDRAPNYTRQFRAVVDTDVGGTVITHPYKMKVIEADTDQTAKVTGEAYMAANPSFWFAPVDFKYSDQISRSSSRSLLFILYNEDSADGAANWDPGYATGGGVHPTGPAGGDLSGTYPNPKVGPVTTGYTDSGAIPAAITTLLSVPTASQQDVESEIVLFKGNTRYSFTIRANIADGVTPEWSINDVTIAPPSGGTFDFTITCDISGGNLRIRVTPATGGWSARIRAQELAV